MYQNYNREDLAKLWWINIGNWGKYYFKWKDVNFPNIDYVYCWIWVLCESNDSDRASSRLICRFVDYGLIHFGLADWGL